MSGDTTRRLDRLLLEAATLEGSERCRLLQDAAAEHPSLAAEAERLLHGADEMTESFLEPPGRDLLATLLDEAELPPPPPGDERYRVGECLGVGGMARVFQAFDRQLDRPVALKFLRADDRETRHRLLTEARSQARVRHDHVLDVYETGELDGQPYVAMRYAAGGTLAGLDRSVPLEQRVEILVQVAEGLHAAHRAGLLHGDVKPSNVLIEETPDGELRAWVGDFGIAVEMAGGAGDGESTDGPAGGPLKGTPSYLAPELLDPETRPAADRRADVYSLGVTLHQVLTTAPMPRAGTAWTELREAAPGLPPDLGAVVVRCLAADPADRYPSARAVADDLGRFLAGEVVEAYADHRGYRWGRFAARHRRLLTVAGVSALLLTVALAVAAAMGVRAMRANTLAEQRRHQAEDLIDYMLLDLRQKLEPVGRLDLLDDVGGRAMDYFAAVPEGELTDDELARRSTALHQIAEVRMQRGDLAGAERPLAESLALARELARRDPDDGERLFGLGQSEFWSGYARWERGDLPAARRHFEAYEEVSQRLVELDPERADWRTELSYAHANLGFVLQAQGDLEGALERFRRSLALDRRAAAEATDGAQAAERRSEVALGHNTVGVVLERMGRLDEAMEHYRAELAIRRELDRRVPPNRRWRQLLAISHQYAGALHLARGESAAARPHLEASRAVFAGLVEHDPDNGDWRYKLAWAEIRLGRLEAREGRPGAAWEAWRRAGAMARELAVTDPQRADWKHLAAVADHHPGLAEAAGWVAPEGTPGAAARRAVETLRALDAEATDDRRTRLWLAESLILLGDVESAAGDGDRARAHWRSAVAALAPGLTTRSRDHGLLAPWEIAHRRLGETGEAERARAVLAELGVPPRPE